MSPGGLVFLDTALLWGLAALAVPTLIHLISKRRARRVKFGPLELLLRSQKRTARSIRLRQLLLLLVRTLILACVALALARPVLRKSVAPRVTGAPLVVVVAVDVSASMNAVVDGKSMFARARSKALDAVRSEPTDVRVGAVVCDDVPRDLVPPTFDRAPVVDALEALHAGYRRADLVACAARATSLARTVEGTGERRVVVLSDLAATGFSDTSAPRVDGTGVVVEWTAAATGEPPPNHAVTAVDVERTTGRSGDALEVKFTAEQFLGPAVEVPVDLVVGSRRAARLSLPLEGGKSVTRSFHHALLPPVIIQARPVADAPAQGSAPPAPPAPASSTGAGASSASAAPGEPAPGDTVGALSGDEPMAILLGDDALAVDNEVRLPFDLPAPMSVLLVDGAPQPVPFRDEVFYLESALREAHGGHGRIAVDVVGADNVTPVEVAGARVVVLANVAHLDDAVAKALVEHVKAGGGLFLSMGDQVDVDWYDRALKDVLPSPLRGSKGQALLDDASVAEVLSFTRFRAEHPVLRGLAAGDELTGLSRVRTNTFMLLEPSSDATREVVMRFSNDAPALVERSIGDGRVMLLATTVDRDWSDLAIRPGFLPLMRQIVLYLGGGLDQGGPRILHVGDARRIRVARGTETVEVEPPRGDRKKIAVSADALDVVFKDTDLPGLYRVFTRAPGGDARERAEERFTVLIDPAESNLERAPPELLAQSAPQGAVTRTSEPNDGDVPLWPWLLCGAVALVLVEALVLRRRSQV